MNNGVLTAEMGGVMTGHIIPDTNAAYDLGASPFQAFLRVTLPLSIPGVAVGAFLTFVITIGDYVTPQILGGNTEVLIPQAPIDYAKGKLDTGPILKHYIQYASRQLQHPTQRGLDNMLAAA